jgi:hypothetical protein
MPKKDEQAEELKTIQILLAGLLLKGEPRPEVGKLETLIHVRKGTLSEIFPQRKNRRKEQAAIESPQRGENDAKR